MVVYADTSFLFSLYAQDAHTGTAASCAAALARALLLTPLQRFELRNALRLSVFRGDMAELECRRLIETIDDDVRTGILATFPVAWDTVFAQAETLSLEHARDLGTRGFDVLHVACALALGAGQFCTFDSRQKELALRAGMTVPC